MLNAQQVLKSKNRMPPWHIEGIGYLYPMKIVLASIGKQHDSYVTEGIKDFTKRINKYYTCDWTIIAPPKNAASLSETELKKQEAIAIDNFLQKEDFLILLDERGKNISSVEVAHLLEEKAVSGCKRIVFLIGGAFGVDEFVFQKAGFVWSLSKLVFPHMLVRLLLSEQIYRACTIIRGEKYHHL